VAINPASDIVLDVARAADPEKYRAAVERLARLRAAAPTEEVFTPPMEAQAPQAPATAAVPAAANPSHARVSAGRHPQLDAYGKFEAFVLQSFLESMLPKNATAVFGQGSAGEFWRSMLAEKLGTELARSGQVGIAERLARGPTPSQPPAGDTPAPAPASTPPVTERT
jgi:flagellar protein FlgJ